MSRIYDNWERLVQATLKREQYYELCRAHSRTPSVSSLSSDFTFPSPAVDSPSPAVDAIQSHSTVETRLAQPLPKRVFNSYRFNFLFSLKAKIKSFQSSSSSDQPEQNKPELRKSFSKRRGKLHHSSNSFSGEISSASKQSESILQKIEKGLKMRGGRELSNDLELFRQILEALQPEGILHSRKSSEKNQRPKTEELKEEGSLLERCDKLLHSIAEMVANDAQPSPYPFSFIVLQG